MKLKRFIYLLCATFFVLFAEASTPLAPSRTAPFSITALSCDCPGGGSGLCVVIRMPSGKTYLFDTGVGLDDGTKWKNNGRDIVAPWLRAHGITELEGVLISHYHSDHFGGFLWLWDHFPIKKVACNGYLPPDDGNMKSSTCGEFKMCQRILSAWEEKTQQKVLSPVRAGTDLGWDEPGVTVRVVWPAKEFYAVAIPDPKRPQHTVFYHDLLNANSTSLQITVGEKKFYIGGDTMAPYVTKYARPYEEAHGTWGGDVCVIPNHGFPDSWKNIAAMKPKPEIAIGSLGTVPWMISLGRSVLQHYIEDAGIRKTYCTNIHGDITVSTDGHTFHVSCDGDKLYPIQKKD